MVWDINTKFLPVEDHKSRQLLTKFEGSWCAQIWISCQNILKLKWAWRAQFLSYAFQILQKCITFEDAQMILLALLKILSLNRIFKKSIQLLVHTGAVLELYALKNQQRYVRLCIERIISTSLLSFFAQNMGDIYCLYKIQSPASFDRIGSSSDQKLVMSPSWARLGFSSSWLGS